MPHLKTEWWPSNSSHSTSSNSNTQSGIPDRAKQQVTYPPSFLPFAFYSDLPPNISKWSMPHTHTPRCSHYTWSQLSEEPRVWPGPSVWGFLCMGWCFYSNNLCFWAPLCLLSLPSPSLCSWRHSFHPGSGPAHVWAKAVLRKNHLLLPLIT